MHKLTETCLLAADAVQAFYDHIRDSRLAKMERTAPLPVQHLDPWRQTPDRS